MNLSDLRAMLCRRPAYTPQLDAPLWRGTDLPDPYGTRMPTFVTSRTTFTDTCTVHIRYPDDDTPQIWIHYEDAGITVRLDPGEAADLVGRLADALDELEERIFSMTATRRDRYAQCDDTCTTDCGACKGNGRPTETQR